MTSCAGVIADGKVFEQARRAHLALLRQTGRVVVTIRATEPVAPAVLYVTEAHEIGRRVGGGPRIRFLIVANAARGDFAAIRSRVGLVTRVAALVRADSRRN